MSMLKIAIRCFVRYVGTFVRNLVFVSRCRRVSYAARRTRVVHSTALRERYLTYM